MSIIIWLMTFNDSAYVARLFRIKKWTVQNLSANGTQHGFDGKLFNSIEMVEFFNMII